MMYGVMDEIASVSPIYGGISFDRIENIGLQWPCGDKHHPGTKFLHQGQFKRGKGKFHPVEYIAPNENTSKKYPLILSTGRELYQFHTGTMTRKSPTIDQKSPTGYVEIHPENAKALGIENGGQVEVATIRGKVTTRPPCTGRAPPVIPVPPPRATRGKRWRRARLTMAATWDACSGKATASGGTLPVPSGEKGVAS